MISTLILRIDIHDNDIHDNDNYIDIVRIDIHDICMISEKHLSNVTVLELCLFKKILLNIIK